MTRVQTWTADAKARQERAANGDEWQEDENDHRGHLAGPHTRPIHGLPMSRTKSIIRNIVQLDESVVTTNSRRTRLSFRHDI
jgi:aspartate carbamoyltransferase catalytic subunit